MGLPQGDGAVSTVASFAGGISWQCSLFDVMKSKDWPRVIEALTSNVEVSDIYIYILYYFHLKKQLTLFVAVALSILLTLLIHSFFYFLFISFKRVVPMKWYLYLNDPWSRMEYFCKFSKIYILYINLSIRDIVILLSGPRSIVVDIF